MGNSETLSPSIPTAPPTTSLIAAVIFCAVLLISWMVLLATHDDGTSRVAMITAMILNTLLLIAIIRLAVSPFQPIAALIDLAHFVVGALIKEDLMKIRQK